MMGGTPASPRPASFLDQIAGSDALIGFWNDICATLPRSFAGDLAQKPVARRELAAEALQEPLEALSAFRAGRVPRGLRQRRRDGHPETDEERQGFPKDGEILIEPRKKLAIRPNHVNQAAMDGVIRDAMQEALSKPDADVAEMAKKYQQRLNDLAAAVPSGK